ncbi:MAG: outer membrane protein assembly factor BamE [Gammaproteobacteria bacterium]|nr:outer membrane protein assembly factor BamE [Gammaproteobacteria bacterium]
MQIPTTTLLLFLLTPLAFSCASILPDPHKLDIQQGNRLKLEDVNKLKVGMTRKQVEFILGTPLLKDGFHGNRWDYIDYFKPGNGEPEQSRLSLYFNGDELSKIDNRHFKISTDKAENPDN